LDIAGYLLINWEEKEGLVLFCGLDIPGFVLVEREERQGLI
jgi:hypothetical protein